MLLLLGHGESVLVLCDPFTKDEPTFSLVTFSLHEIISPDMVCVQN